MNKNVYLKSKRSECKSCGRIIIGTPLRCPNCGAYLQIRWLIGAVILIIFLSLIVFQVIGNKSHKINTARIIEGMPPLTADIKPCTCQSYTLNNREQNVLNNLLVDGIYETVVTADKLQSDYESDKVVADKSYKDKTFLIAGEVKSINRGKGENNYISLYGERGKSNEPHAFMADGFAYYLGDIKKGKIVHLVCGGGGISTGSALLNECIPANIYIKNRLNDFCKDCSEYVHGAQNTFWYTRKVAQILPDKSDCFGTDIRKYKNCITEISSLVNENTMNVGEDKIKSSFEKAHPSFKKVELIEVPNSDDTVKIILKYDKIDSEYAKDFSVAKFDINNDGKDDILYTNSGIIGPCGYSWSITINKGEGKYEINKCSIVCVDKLLYFSNEYFKGLRIPYDMEEEQAYYCE